MQKSVTRAASAVVCLCVVLLGNLVAPAEAVELGAGKTEFTLDGTPTFLLGMSYYGGLAASPTQIDGDLDDMQRLGLNWIRVWATWESFGNDVSAIDAQGMLRERQLSRLRELIVACDRRGMVVDVTLSRGNGITGPPRLQKIDLHRRAVETLLAALRSHRNWYLDLANERNIEDKRFVSFEELKQLRAAAREVDPKRLITASHAGDLRRDEVRQYLQVVGVDFLSPHRPRHAQSAKETEAQTKQYMAWMGQLGRVVPVHYQEPFRRGFTEGWEPLAEDFVADARGARLGGAAGWCCVPSMFDSSEVQVLSQPDGGEG